MALGSDSVRVIVQRVVSYSPWIERLEVYRYLTCETAETGHDQY